eukprot:scaffold56320_cov23-Tisochrysis_lutea.AAC.3
MQFLSAPTGQKATTSRDSSPHPGGHKLQGNSALLSTSPTAHDCCDEMARTWRSSKAARHGQVPLCKEVPSSYSPPPKSNSTRQGIDTACL